MKTVDCRGMFCPQPVLQTKKALEEAGSEDLLVLVNNPTSKENVRRFAQSQGHRVETAEDAGVFSIRIHKKGAAEKQEPVEEPKTLGRSDLVVFIDSDTLGRGSEELGRILIRSLFHTLTEAGPRPHKLIFINSGVKLACEGSEVLEDLQTLSSGGVEVLSCGTCLDFFGLKEKIRAGRISNMYEIVDSLAKAGKVLKI